MRDPNIVLAEIESAEAPDAYLQSLHPKHEQFQRLRTMGCDQGQGYFMSRPLAAAAMEELLGKDPVW